MEISIEQSWKEIMREEFEKEYFVGLRDKIKHQYLTETIFPNPKNIFTAFSLCPLDRVKVVIIGQDPYHGRGQAHGLSFSVPDGIRVPPSLQNIYKELHADLGVPIPKSGNLERWALQGVLLLNATLSVREGKAGSHQGLGWEQFTDAVIKKISEEKKNIVFLLWGKYAQSKTNLIDSRKHLVLTAPHPSPFSAHTGFLGCRHFSKTNNYLSKTNQIPIKW